MLNWTQIAAQRLSGTLEGALQHYVDKSGGDPADVAGVLEQLYAESDLIDEREEWHALLISKAGQANLAELIRLFEEVIGHSEDEIFPEYDPVPARIRALQAEVPRRKRAPKRAPKRARRSPDGQIEFGFPQVAPPPPAAPPRLRGAERPLVEKLMRAWLHDGRPMPYVAITLTGRRKRSVWAAGRLFDGGRVLIVFKDAAAVGEPPVLQYRGLNIYYDPETGMWFRAKGD